jgi:hypothetical protein
MPIVQVKINLELDTEKKNELILSVSHLVADIMEKPFSDIMVMYSYSDIVMAGSFEPAAFIDFRCISGLNHMVSKSICEGILSVFKRLMIQIEESRIYINFFEVSKTCAWRFIGNFALCPESLEPTALMTDE